MNKKTQKIKKATRKTRWGNFKKWCKKVILFPIRAIKWLWRLICRICRAIWNWLKSIDIIGMINLTLLVAIIVLFLSLILILYVAGNLAKLLRQITNLMLL